MTLREPVWSEAADATDWRWHVPPGVRGIWIGLDDEQRFQLFLWADRLADDWADRRD